MLRRTNSCPQPGFTLIELLVVIGIIGVLAGILLPALQKARKSADRTLCATRLREMVNACTNYQVDHKSLPGPSHLPIQNVAIPHFVRISVLNKLQPYLSYSEINDDTSVEDLPRIVKCPIREQYELAAIGRSMPLPGQATILTGYQYTAMLDQPENLGGQMLQRNRSADARGRRRGVVWADTLTWYSGSGLVFMPPGLPPGWAYFHFRQRVEFNGMSINDPSALEGQHRAWSDGSVEWVRSHELELDISKASENASYRCDSSGTAFAYFWF